MISKTSFKPNCSDFLHVPYYLQYARSFVDEKQASGVFTVTKSELYLSKKSPPSALWLFSVLDRATHEPMRILRHQAARREFDGQVPRIVASPTQWHSYRMYRNFIALAYAVKQRTGGASSRTDHQASAVREG